MIIKRRSNDNLKDKKKKKRRGAALERGELDTYIELPTEVNIPRESADLLRDVNQSWDVHKP